jgi:hypothetical protein
MEKTNSRDITICSSSSCCCFQVLVEIAAIHISLLSLRNQWEAWATLRKPMEAWALTKTHGGSEELRMRVMMMETHLNVLW